MNHIGIRLRQIRESKGLTQQNLELAIDASFGHISRIESGKVNPSKETLLHIAESLHMSQLETISLLGLNTAPVGRVEVEAAISHTAGYLKTSNNPTYLSDDFWFVWGANDVFLEILGLPTGEAAMGIVTPLLGTHLLEFIFNPELGLKPLLSNEEWSHQALKQCQYFMQQTEYFVRRGQPWLSTLLTRLRKLPDFTDIWKQAETKFSLGEFDRHDFFISFVIGGHAQKFVMTDTTIPAMPRFYVTEYVPV